MEILEEKFLSANKDNLDTKQVLVECVLTLEQGGQIEKVLALSAESSLINVESFEKETKFSGEIFTNLLYLTPENEIGSALATATFGENFKHDVLNEGQKVKGDVKVVSVSLSSVQEANLKVLVTVEVALTLEGNKKVDAYVNENKNNCVKQGVMALNVLAQDVSGSFSSEKSLEVKDKVTKVLVASSNAVLKEITPGVGYVSVSGDIYTYVVYAKEGGGFVHTQVVQDFKEELEVDSATKDSLIEANLKVKNSDLTVTLTEREEGTELVFNTPLKIFLKVYKEKEFDTVSDVYSLTNELDVTIGNVTNLQVLPSKYFEGKIEGNLTLTENQARIDKVLTVSAPRLTVSNYYTKENEVFVEGVVYSNVIYLNDDESTIHSVEIEVPFVTSEKVMSDFTGTQVKPIVAISDCDVIAKRGREIYFDCKVKVFANLWTTQSQSLITKVTEGRAFLERDSAIEIYFAKTGDTLWDIAKELRIEQETIKGQNPTLVCPLEHDEKVVVYYGLE